MSSLDEVILPLTFFNTPLSKGLSLKNDLLLDIISLMSLRENKPFKLCKVIIFDQLSKDSFPNRNFNLDDELL